MAHTIIELEDGALAMTVVGGTRQDLEVTTCMRMPLGELAGSSLLQTLKSLRSELPEESGKVHLLLGERRCHHFTLAVPLLAKADLEALVLREALRIGGLAAGTPMLVRARYLRRQPDRRLLLGVTSLPRSAVDPVLKAFADAHIEVESLGSIEDGLALAIDPDLPPRTAVLEYSAGRARFALCEHGAPVQVRRFLVAGVDQSAAFDAAVMAAQLAMEVPRTLDYLRDQGQAKPDALLVSHRVGIPAEDLQMFTGEVELARAASPRWRVATGQDQPGLATYGFARALLGSTAPASLLAGTTVQLPTQRWRQLVAGALLATGLTATVLAIGTQGELGSLQREQVGLRTEVERLERQAAELATPAAPAEESALQKHFLQTLATRRPHSLLLAAVCNATPPGCMLTKVVFSRDEDVVVEGHAGGDTRRRAYAVLAEFGDRLRQIGCVLDQRREDVADSDTQGRMHFVFHLHWRRS